MARFDLQKLYIDGGYSDAGSDATFEAINPANGEVLAQVQRATFDDVERAVVSAEKGQKIWAAMTAMERSRILRRAVRYGYTFLEMHEPFMYRLVPTLIEVMGEDYPELNANSR